MVTLKPTFIPESPGHIELSGCIRDSRETGFWSSLVRCRLGVDQEKGTGAEWPMPSHFFYPSPLLCSTLNQRLDLSLIPAILSL